ncbi:MurR/RpiR family transcriptional regulator [Tsukamurella tyrosinosolvens]|uniref:MurR/RpiR family transcriptional regulator n=1 Tax=Tsukamurella tyrosinosolvens TaxID=57704 RepID=UPI003F4A7678
MDRELVEVHGPAVPALRGGHLVHVVPSAPSDLTKDYARSTFLEEYFQNSLCDTRPDAGRGAVDGTIDRIRSVVPTLRPAEAKIAATVIADPARAVAATITELAEAAGASQASVVRFARALGFGGYPDLRIALAQELSRRQVELERSDIAEGAINDEDDLAGVVAKIAFHEARSLEQTARLIDHDALETVAQAIAEHGRCHAFGVGASGLAALDLSQKLQRIGLSCQYSPDTHMQLVHAALATPDSVAVAVSFSGTTVEVHRALTLARQRGALGVAVTNAPESPLGRAADRILLTVAQESPLRAAALASRLTQLAVVDFLFIRIAQLRYGDLESALAITREAVLPQHLPPTS